MEQLVRPATVQRNLVVHLLEHHLELIDIHTIGTHGTFLSLKRSSPFAKTEQCVFVQAARTLVEGSRTETRCSINTFPVCIIGLQMREEKSHFY